MNDLDTDSSAHSAYDASLRFLAHRPRSRAEVRRRLQRRAFSETVVESALQRLETEGYLDDGAFARYWTENRRQFSPRSKSLLSQELRLKGVEAETIALALEELDDETEALAAAVKKVPSLHRYAGKALQERLITFLRRRGFTFTVAQRAARKAAEEHQEAAQ